MREVDDSTVLQMRLDFDQAKRRYERSMAAQRLWFYLLVLALAGSGYLFGRYGIESIVEAVHGTIVSVV